MLRGEFSAPKMLYGNNRQEMTADELPKLVDALEASLREAGVVIPKAKLFKAQVSAIHYSKNFVLTDGSIPNTYLTELRRCNISTRMGFGETEYRNGGHDIRWQCKSLGCIFYDKLAEMGQEATMREQIKSFRLARQKPYEVLRFEVRLNKRPQIRAILQKAGFPVEQLTLGELFSERIAQAVLLHYIHKLECSYPPISPDEATTAPYRLFCQTAIDNPQASPRTLLANLGLSVLENAYNTRELRGLLGAKRRRAWDNLIGALKGMNLQGKKPSVFTLVKKGLNSFAPVKEVEFIAQTYKLTQRATDL
jgi:hypothetical protein